MAAFNLDRLVAASAGFSGAEIEQAVVAALYTAFAGGRTLTSDLLVIEIASTQPLSRTMAERVDALREWAAGRTVSAN